MAGIHGNTTGIARGYDMVESYTIPIGHGTTILCLIPSSTQVIQIPSMPSEEVTDTVPFRVFGMT